MIEYYPKNKRDKTLKIITTMFFAQISPVGLGLGTALLVSSLMAGETWQNQVNSLPSNCQLLKKVSFYIK